MILAIVVCGACAISILLTFLSTRWWPEEKMFCNKQLIKAEQVKQKAKEAKVEYGVLH